MEQVEWQSVPILSLASAFRQGLASQCVFSMLAIPDLSPESNAHCRCPVTTRATVVSRQRAHRTGCFATVRACTTGPRAHMSPGRGLPMQSLFVHRNPPELRALVVQVRLLLLASHFPSSPRRGKRLSLSLESTMASRYKIG